MSLFVALSLQLGQSLPFLSHLSMQWSPKKWPHLSEAIWKRLKISSEYRTPEIQIHLNTLIFLSPVYRDVVNQGLFYKPIYNYLYNFAYNFTICTIVYNLITYHKIILGECKILYFLHIWRSKNVTKFLKCFNW